MDRRRIAFTAVLAVVLLVAAATGCTFVRRTGPLQTESQTVELQGAETATVDLRMGAGELTVSGGGDALMEADFTYNVAEWEPIVEYDVSGGQGDLTVRQPDVENLAIDDYRYEWDIRFAEDVPMDMTIGLGAGRSNLDVADLDLTSLTVNAGAGDTTLDLAGGDWPDGLDVSMRGGVGRATIYLPPDVGVRVEVDGGIGQVSATGLRREGDAYVNELYDGGEAALTLDIEGGVGQINLKVVD
jgi:hypothetical protein